MLQPSAPQSVSAKKIKTFLPSFLSLTNASAAPASDSMDGFTPLQCHAMPCYPAAGYPQVRLPRSFPSLGRFPPSRRTRARNSPYAPTFFLGGGVLAWGILPSFLLTHILTILVVCTYLPFPKGGEGGAENQLRYDTILCCEGYCSPTHSPIHPVIN